MQADASGNIDNCENGEEGDGDSSEDGDYKAGKATKAMGRQLPVTTTNTLATTMTKTTTATTTTMMKTRITTAAEMKTTAVAVARVMAMVTMLWLFQGHTSIPAVQYLHPYPSTPG
ncbi:hypothetical protein EDB85DRAFT_1894711 [Lactarius pseudohatsudake]|nr:hypothetical protein EDB85DRAFT_1894711 [Lactarius pseudohatsudake]